MSVADYFLKLDGIDGESQDSKHKNEIHLESYSWGAMNQGTHSSAGGGGAGKVAMQDFSFTAPVDKSYPKLFLACATGDHIKKAVLTARKAGKDQQDYLVITMSDLMVSSISLGGSGHDSHLPLQSFSLNYAKVEVDYKEQKVDGSLGASVKAGYDLKAQKHT